MRYFLKTIFVLAVALAVLLVVRFYAFTVYAVPTDIDQTLRRGDRVVVNKLSHVGFKKGDLMVFRCSRDIIGRVEGVPGDTVAVDSGQYLIPRICCSRCRCLDCKLYLVNLGRSRTLVYRHQVLGHAYKLFHLSF